MDFNFSSTGREVVVQSVLKQLEEIYHAPRKELRVSKTFHQPEIESKARAFCFDKNNKAEDVMRHVIDSIKNEAVNVTHPSYFGLFNPRPSFPSIMADVINSYLNPQLAAWSHSPYASEVERFVIKEFCNQFGYVAGQQDGTFCTGGAESNLTAVICALNKSFPNYSEKGLLGISVLPTIYCSSESHHSIEKAARIVGLGKVAVRKVPVCDDLTIDVKALDSLIQADKLNDCHPIMVVGTAGTTGAGAIDNLDLIAVVCRQERLWFHVDAAYGGGAIITDCKHLLSGIEHSDSITLDLHKWFSVPMATSLFLTSDTTILGHTFGVRTDYMPEDSDPDRVIDPYIHSVQWSRRFIGLKIYLPLAIFGWNGYTSMLNHQIRMGHLMREQLERHGWNIVNQSELPIICFTHPDFNNDNELVQQFIDEINNQGETWFSSYPIKGRLTLRAQIANYETNSDDIVKFVKLVTGKLVELK